jgi:hypothetical protein
VKYNRIERCLFDLAASVKTSRFTWWRGNVTVRVLIASLPPGLSAICPSVMDHCEPKLRWYRLRPDHVIVGLLAAECLLWLSDREGSPEWHKGYAVLTGVGLLGVAIATMLVWFLVACLLRQQFQFGVRTLLVLAVAVALPCSWMTAAIKKADDEKKTAASLMRWGGIISFDWQVDIDGNDLIDPQAPACDWLRVELGDFFFATVVAVRLDGRAVTDADLKTLVGMRQLRTLSLGPEMESGFNPVAKFSLHQQGWGGQITDDGMQYLGGLTGLQQLNLSGRWEVTDAGLAHLRTLSGLKKLWLYRTGLSDRGLEYLRTLHQLRMLNVSYTQITDKGLTQLASFTELEILLLSQTHISDGGLEQLKNFRRLNEVDVSHTSVTDEGVARLRQTLPNCKIRH